MDEADRSGSNLDVTMGRYSLDQRRGEVLDQDEIGDVYNDGFPGGMPSQQAVQYQQDVYMEVQQVVQS